MLVKEGVQLETCRLKENYVSVIVRSEATKMGVSKDILVGGCYRNPAGKYTKNNEKMEKYIVEYI